MNKRKEQIYPQFIAVAERLYSFRFPNCKGSFGPEHFAGSLDDFKLVDAKGSIIFVSPDEESWELSRIEEKLQSEYEMQAFFRRWEHMYISKKLADAGC
jgi:hypothetical protein